MNQRRETAYQHISKRVTSRAREFITLGILCRVLGPPMPGETDTRARLVNGH